MIDANLICEKLADLEHEQWIQWSKTIAEREPISEETKKRWEKYWVPYSELTEEVKEYDRKWARKAMAIILEQIEVDDGD